MSRYLGQHFLTNKSAITKIISSLDLQSGDLIIEIGPGEGALTIPLAGKCGEIGCKVIAIEKDVKLAANIAGTLKNAEIVEGDALKKLSEIISKTEVKFKIAGNIPYYITGKLLRILGEMEVKPELIVLTIQKEVAERVAASPPKMNLLAAATQIWSHPEILMKLKPKDFNPPPEVESAIIKLSPFSPEIDLKAYYQLIKVLFKQPRKTVLNNLSTGLGISKGKAVEILKKCGLEGHERPQNLPLNILQKLLTFTPLGKEG